MSEQSEKNEQRILIFGGTTEGRLLSRAGFPCVYSAATDYGAELAAGEADKNDAEIRAGRLDDAGMAALLERPDIVAAIDATHPYATEVRRNIANACAAAAKPLFRVERASADDAALGEQGKSEVMRFASCAEAADWLAQAAGNALVAVGSKEMDCFTRIPDFGRRLYFRVLPTSGVIARCEELDVRADRIIAEQGPFSELANRAHLERANARFLVTKDGGPQGGMAEKLSAARICGAKVLLVERPDAEGVLSGVAIRGTLEEAVAWACDLLGLRAPKPPMFPMFVNLAGAPVTVVGGGRVALRKARVLAHCGANLRVVAPEIHSDFEKIKSTGSVELIKREYLPEDLRGAKMAIAATDDRAVNAAVAELANRDNIPVNVADAPGACSFFFPSLVEHDGYVAGISSSGRSPRHCRALADRLRAVWRSWVELVELSEKENG